MEGVEDGRLDGRAFETGFRDSDDRLRSFRQAPAVKRRENRVL